MPPAIISAQRVVYVPMDQARAWFLSLEDHPERYRFATHDGIQFVHGSFGEVGSRFKTRERFYFLRLALLFELFEVGQTWFSFRLASPSWAQVWGAFRMQELDSESISLYLEIGSFNQWGQFWLRFFPVAAAIRRQITREVVHVKTSMESGI